MASSQLEFSYCLICAIEYILLPEFQALKHKSAVLLNQIRNHIQNRHENPKDKTGKEYRMSCQSFERMLIRVESVAKFVEEENFRKYETSRMRPKSIQVLTSKKY